MMTEIRNNATETLQQNGGGSLLKGGATTWLVSAYFLLRLDFRVWAGEDLAT